MKLRVRINRQTCRVELPGAEPSLRELMDHIQETVLSSHGLSADTEFTLSLNGSDRLSDSGQTLSSLGIVSGDLICVILPESAAAAPAPAPAPGPTSSSSSGSGSGSSDRPSSSSGSQGQRRQQMAAVSSDQASSSRHPAAFTQSDPTETLDPDPDLVPVPIPSWEPMLCSEAGEGQAPLSLELLYHTAQTSSPSDAIMVAGNLLMLETGFIPQGADLKSTQMPDGWRSGGGVYKMQYTHPLCENSVAMVVGVCMGPVLVINATLKVNQIVDTVRKLCLNPSSYITDEWPGESAAAAFKDLTKLSRVFKDQLAYPLIAAAREAMALPVAFGLAALPPELFLRVVRLLDVRSVVRLSSVCRHFHSSTSDSTLWRHLYRRDFTDPDPVQSRDTDWKQLYKKHYKLRSERLAARHRSFPLLPRSPWDIGPLPRPLPLHPPVPGIIGGEYDQRPNLPRPLLPRPRYDPIGPLHDGRPLSDFRRPRPPGGRPAADVQRGFI